MLPGAGGCREVWGPAEPVAGEQEATPLPAPSHLDASAIWVQVPPTPSWGVPGAGAFLPSAVSIAPAALHPALLLLRDVEAVAKRHRNVSIWPSRKKRGKKKKERQRKRETREDEEEEGRKEVGKDLLPLPGSAAALAAAAGAALPTWWPRGRGRPPGDPRLTTQAQRPWGSEPLLIPWPA